MEVISCLALSKVLGVQVEYVDESILVTRKGSYLMVRTINESIEYEIHFLLEKCKDWIRKNGFTIDIHLCYIDDDNRTYVRVKIDSGQKCFSTDEDDEQDAVIKAVEFISANMEKDQK
jgi:hypothetical protein